MHESMLCYQCEQSKRPEGCDVAGNCGKDPRTAALQDLIVHVAKGLAVYAHEARVLGATDRACDRTLVHGLFTTVTNVSFDEQRLTQVLHEVVQARDRAKALYLHACATQGRSPAAFNGPCALQPATQADALVRQGQDVGLRGRLVRHGPDITGLQELLLYGVKGTAAYAHHAQVLGLESDEVYGFFHEALAYLERGKPEVAELLRMNLRCGEINLRVMELLDQAHTSTYGHPEPTPVRVEPLRGKAILVSGHDLKDLEALLEQTAGTGINVYTHGEMLPAHGYPGLRKYKHLVGNYGGAWQDQAREFDAFPGAILMTTNCIQQPRSTYKDRIFTTGLVAWPGVKHVQRDNFKPVIEAALAAPGFESDGPDKTILTGFARKSVLSVADKVIEAVKAGHIRHFFLVGGCDGAKPGRNYYTDFVQNAPADTVILTLACGKYRFNHLDLGDIGGIPRLLDIGQCNDAYSAIQIAVALAQAFGTDVNSLPLSLVLSWYEQKAVAILLTLLHLGIRNIRLGPSLPPFVSPNVLQVLVEKFNVMPITTAEQDLNAILS